jgi:hypothetical protein
MSGGAQETLEIWEMKNTVTEMRNAFHELIKRIWLRKQSMNLKMCQ